MQHRLGIGSKTLTEVVDMVSSFWRPRRIDTTGLVGEAYVQVMIGGETVRLSLFELHS